MTEHEYTPRLSEVARGMGAKSGYVPGQLVGIMPDARLNERLDRLASPNEVGVIVSVTIDSNGVTGCRVKRIGDEKQYDYSANRLVPIDEHGRRVTTNGTVYLRRLPGVPGYPWELWVATGDGADCGEPRDEVPST